MEGGNSSSSKLDQSLGDIISSDKGDRGEQGDKTGRSGRSGRRRGRGPKAAADGAQQRDENGGSNGGGAANPLSRQADSDLSASASSSSSGPVRRNRRTDRKSPYPTSATSSASNQSAGRWQHNRYMTTDVPTSAPTLSMIPSSLQPHTAATIQRVVGDTVHITNLHGDVKADDLFDIFAPLGHIRSHVVHFDERGRSLGTATVSFQSADVADAAVAEFDGAEIDGKAMAVKLVGHVVQQRLGGGGGGAGGEAYMDAMTNPAAAAAMMLPAMMQMMAAGLPLAGRHNGQQQQQRQQAAGKGKDRSGQQGGKQKGEEKGRGREQKKADGAAPSAAGKDAAGGKGGRGRKERAPVTSEDLDAEMESYHTQRNASAQPATAESSAAGNDTGGAQPVKSAADASNVTAN